LKHLHNQKFRNLLLSIPVLVFRSDIAGVLFASTLFCALHFGIPLLKALEHVSPEDLSDDEVCEFIELFLLGTNAGLTKLETLNLVAETSSGPLPDEIAEVIARCNLGISLVTSLGYTAKKYPNLGQAIRTISRSELTGGPITEALELELTLTQAKSANDALRRVRSLSVKCVLPLGLCFLPAFFLLTIVPIVASMLPKIFSTMP